MEPMWMGSKRLGDMMGDCDVGWFWLQREEDDDDDGKSRESQGKEGGIYTVAIVLTITDCCRSCGCFLINNSS